VATGVEKKKSRVLSGMRPTGRMHIGNYFGALANWVRLQNATAPISDVVSQAGAQHAAPLQGEDPQKRTGQAPPLTGQPAYECFYFIADWHSLTSDYADTSGITQNVIEIATDYLAGGLDPAKSVLFLQSLVPEHAELHLLLSMVTPLGWLERVPTYKEALENIKDKDLHNYGFLGYPVLQCGDIVMYGEPGVPLIVPVGEDQVSHVETSREIVRRFNAFNGMEVNRKLFLKENSNALLNVCTRIDLHPNLTYPLEQGIETFLIGKFRTIAAEWGIPNFLEQMKDYGKHFSFQKRLTEPEVMLTKTPRIPGTDGRKMSKSYGNAITLSESDADIRAKTKVMMTDPARKRRTDPGNPDVCPVYDWHKLFSAEEPGRLEWVRQGCTTAGIGCIECKEAMANNLIKWITPIRERRAYYEGKKKLVRQIIQDGSLEARKAAVHTMRRLRDAVFGKERILRKTLPGAARAKRPASRARAQSD
jgi:tryptophanyl-tRNA synthetase